MSTPSAAVQRVAECLQGLTPREKRVLTLRFALDGQGNRTLDEVSEALALSADEVRSVELGALATLARA